MIEAVYGGLGLALVVFTYAFVAYIAGDGRRSDMPTRRGEPA